MATDELEFATLTALCLGKTWMQNGASECTDCTVSYDSAASLKSF